MHACGCVLMEKHVLLCNMCYFESVILGACHYLCYNFLVTIVLMLSSHFQYPKENSNRLLKLLKTYKSITKLGLPWIIILYDSAVGGHGLLRWLGNGTHIFALGDTAITLE